MPVYSFGEDSPLKFNIPDKTAKHYNEAAKEFFQAQRRFMQKFGREWDPINEPIHIGWTRAQRKAWNDFGKIFNKVNTEQGPFHVNEILDDYLVRNSSQTLANASRRLGTIITTAALLGAVYGLLRRRKTWK